MMRQKTTKVYISGPISGLDRDDYMGRFRTADRMLRQRGFRVCNPTRFLVCRWPWLYRIVGYRLTLLYDVYQLTRCDCYCQLPFSQSSRGCRVEAYVAAAFGIPKISLVISNEIDSIICKDIALRGANEE